MRAATPNTPHTSVPKMLDITDFEAVYSFNPDYALSQGDVHKIHNNRRTLNGTLFFDRLLKQLHISGIHHYPPANNGHLRHLHHNITTAPIPAHHAQSLLYYILKDSHPAGSSDPASSFAKACHLPPRYTIVVDGLWHLDHLHLRPAVEALTHPSLLPTFPAEILAALLDNCDDEGPDADLPFAYFNSVGPPLTEERLRKAYFEYVCRMSVSEAYAFMHTQPSHVQQELLTLLVSAALTHASSAEERADRSVELVDLPLTGEEEGWMEEFLLNGSGKGLNGARDTVMMRRIATGRYTEALEVGQRLTGLRHTGVNWKDVQDKLQKGLGPRAKESGLFME
ncbi:hypothetical protein K490DRAFT_44601 [Saccharata proteae CBS 121410]|uniref:ELYS-like domain-containing protein n=1 Tax=Saccharata proteae CBS 121410 TaxID=1314787 RepID=A0A9P4HW15_9PEZI|nr:hypothetical protein K490DRAFT_44601 [Saccharata proteae CBS 121410]